MSSVNLKTEKIYTHEGGTASRVNPLAMLRRSVMSCLLWEGEFYESGETIADRIKDLCKQVSAKDLMAVALEAKNDMRLRHVPLLLAREAMRTKEGRSTASVLIPGVVKRVDDITEFLAMWWRDDKDEPLAKQVKKHLGNCFRKFDEYQLAKYNGSSKSVKLRDALRILRPKPDSPERSELWRKLVKGELATPDTWEVELSKGGDKKASWTRLLDEGKLGGLAMLRNLRNMREAGVDHAAIKAGVSRIEAGRLLPINFISAAKHNPYLESEIEGKFFECFANRAKDSKPTTVLVDVSGSMDAQLSGKSELKRMDVACSLAMIAREMFTDLRVVTFSNRLVEIPARRGFALRECIVNSQPHGGTQLGAALATLAGQIGESRIIVVTDEQSSDRVPQMKGYMVNVASSKNGVGYGTWTHVDGWSDKVLDYIVRLEGIDSPAAQEDDL